jgi:NADH dehydrogenase
VAEKPFRYHDLGSAAYISRGRAVVSAGPLQVGGFLGWVIWLFIHIAFLTGYRNRVGALLTWWLAFARNLRRERTFTTQQLETRDVYTFPLGVTGPESGAHSSAAPSGVSGDGKVAHP